MQITAAVINRRRDRGSATEEDRKLTSARSGMEARWGR
jgi:hypothetical protein